MLLTSKMRSQPELIIQFFTMGTLAKGESIFVIIPMSGRLVKHRQFASNTLKGSSAAISRASTSASKEKQASPSPHRLVSEYSPGESMISAPVLVYWVLW